MFARGTGWAWFRALTAAAYAWQVHGWLWAIAVFVLLFGLLPGAVTFVLAWLETNKAKPDQDILSVMRLRDRTMWALYLLVMAAIALSGSRVLG